MKIAQLSTRLPPGPGGVERHVAEISKRMAGRGHAVTDYATDLFQEYPWRRLGPEVRRTEFVEGVTIRRLRAWSLPGELHYPFFRGLSAALERDRPEILHVHTYGTNHAAVARRFSRRHRTPYVLTAHFHPIWSIYGGWLRHRIRGFYDRFLAGPIVADASRLVVQSQEELRLIRKNGFSLPQVVTIPPGYTPLPPPKEGEHPFADSIGVHGPFALFVGRLASNKGLPQLLQAFAGLRRTDPSATLVLVGEDGGERTRVETRITELDLGSSVRLTGFIEDERRLASAFREARLFVLPSEYEAFGLVLLEALAQGTPVVASRVGGIPEFIEEGKAGRLVAPLDAEALEKALVELWPDQTTRERLGAYGRDTVVPRYTWDRVTDRLLELYQGVVAG